MLADSGQFFDSAMDVAREIEYAEKAPERTRARGRRAQEVALRYDWDDVAARYGLMCERLAARAHCRAGCGRPDAGRNGIDTTSNGSANGTDRRAATGTIAPVLPQRKVE